MIQIDFFTFCQRDGSVFGTPVLNFGARHRDWWMVSGTGGQAARIEPDAGS